MVQKWAGYTSRTTYPSMKNQKIKINLIYNKNEKTNFLTNVSPRITIGLF